MKEWDGQTKKQSEEQTDVASYSVERAQRYINRRFKRDPRMERLDRFERDFAREVFVATGTDSCIVDVPCGSGRFFDLFVGARELVLVDLSEEMLQVAREKSGARKGIRMMKADIRSIPLPPEYADLCFSMRLFHHFRDDATRLAAFRELSRISKRYVALSFYNKNCFRYYWRSLLRKKIRGNYVTFRHMVSLAAQVGLTPVTRYPKINSIEQQCLVLFQKRSPR